MAGIYIHVPFCKRKCPYCDFYSIGVSSKTDMFHLQIIKELELRKSFLEGNQIESIYFGGGTPSLISGASISEILNQINNLFSVKDNLEITIEVNPDDITKPLLIQYLNSSVNRLSVGVQSFVDNELKVLGRRHDSTTSIEAIKLAQDLGFSNISIDLMYGIPQSTSDRWVQSLETAFQLNPQHLSCYHLTFEENTLFYKQLQRKEITPLNETTSIEEYNILRDLAEKAGYIHYEISNFAKEGFISLHNSSYWLGKPYLGVGPSAHSFKNNERWWNPKSFNYWLEGIADGHPRLDGETLDEKSKYNELLITRLRTIFGITINEIQQNFGKEYLDYFLLGTKRHIDQGNIIVENSIYRIPQKKYFISDTIVADLMMD